MSLPFTCVDAPQTQRFVVDDVVSHNGGLITKDSKRLIIECLGYCKHGGFQYRIATSIGVDAGLAYDGELDRWPGDDVIYPILSDRK